MAKNGLDRLKTRMPGSPVTLAAVFASQLEADPIMAAKVKEHLPAKRLMALLEIKGEPHWTPKPLEHWSDEEIKTEVCRRFTFLNNTTGEPQFTRFVPRPLHERQLSLKPDLIKESCADDEYRQDNDHARTKD